MSTAKVLEIFNTAAATAGSARKQVDVMMSNVEMRAARGNSIVHRPGICPSRGKALLWVVGCLLSVISEERKKGSFQTDLSLLITDN
jgi:hypothetical protein